MKIEVVLIDSVDGNNLTSLKNYEENKEKNRNLFLWDFNPTVDKTNPTLDTKLSNIHYWLYFK